MRTYLYGISLLQRDFHLWIILHAHCYLYKKMLWVLPTASK